MLRAMTDLVERSQGDKEAEAEEEAQAQEGRLLAALMPPLVCSSTVTTVTTTKTSSSSRLHRSRGAIRRDRPLGSDAPSRPTGFIVIDDDGGNNDTAGEREERGGSRKTARRETSSGGDGHAKGDRRAAKRLKPSATEGESPATESRRKQQQQQQQQRQQQSAMQGAKNRLLEALASSCPCSRHACGCDGSIRDEDEDGDGGRPHRTPRGLDRFPPDFTPSVVHELAREGMRENCRAFLVRTLLELHTGGSPFQVNISAFAPVIETVLDELRALGWKPVLVWESDGFVVRFPSSVSAFSRCGPVSQPFRMPLPSSSSSAPRVLLPFPTVGATPSSSSG